MKLAVISDIHSNLLALELAIQDLKSQNVDKVLFLGDYLTDGENEKEILKIIKEYGDYVILGNREKYLLNFNPKLKDYSNYRPISYTYNNLEVEDLNYLSSLENHLIINLKGYKILLIHGDEYGHTVDTIEKLFQEYITKYDFDICLFGHTHRYLKEEYQGKLFLNPGSIGEPTDGPTYKYLLINLDKEISFELKEFKVKDTYKKLEKEVKNTKYYQDNFVWSDLILKSIKNGQDYTTPFVKLVNKKVGNKELSPLEYNQIWYNTYEENLKEILKN